MKSHAFVSYDSSTVLKKHVYTRVKNSRKTKK